MNIKITNARMIYESEVGYNGQVEFTVEGHQFPYEITLHSLKGNDWSYGLHFLDEPGKEEEIFALDEYIEDHDDLFDQLIAAATQSCENDPRANSEHKTKLY